MLCAQLRPSNIDASAFALKQLQGIVAQDRNAWPDVAITIRGDSGICRESIKAWRETNGVDYESGLTKNRRLLALTAAEQEEARVAFERATEPSRVFADLEYCTRKTWNRALRVVAKAEHLGNGSNPRFFADRVSTATMRGNQVGLFYSSIAYVLMNAARRLGLGETELSCAQCQTIRLKLLKIGALVRVTVRKVWVRLASSCPDAEVFRRVHANLSRLSPWILRC